MSATLYYSPASCGAASFIAAYAAGVNLNTVQIDLATHKTSNGDDFYTINPKGNVPALVLADGTLLNEGAAVLQYIADQKPGSIAPEVNTTPRYQVMNVLNYVASELHPAVGTFFYPKTEEEKSAAMVTLEKKLKYVNDTLVGEKSYVVGDKLTIADAYTWVVLSWFPYLKLDLAIYPNLTKYFDAISNLETVKEAQARMSTNPATVLDADADAGCKCIIC